MNEVIEKRFWSKIGKKGNDECWEWKRHKTPLGYGRFWNGNRLVNAHRIAWELINGAIPEGMNILHKCDNRACCNPNHLYLGDQSDNNSDRAWRNPNNQGGHTKLYRGEIWLIRKLKIKIGKTSVGIPKYKFSARYVAKMFKVSARTILRIWNSPKYPCKEGYYI